MTHPNLTRWLGLLLLLSTFTAQAVDEVFSTEDGALRGYDVVAYHTEHKPVLGSAAITHPWNGVTWRFANEANRDRFAADPQRYAPQYGGYCAYGTSRGYKVSTQPEAFAIVDGKLYLNYNTEVQKTWNQDQPTFIQQANQVWQTLEDQPYEKEAK
ncbi:YHS domain-containing (seleno)protein [Pseudomarimonas arenosa]|uniref:YHS domain-containing protein n=1 Tax=Pseudomarimonas arenosa TaxID=2774145 RepID=A0AAW3ZI69_9GAMM|nr:YHS domain-containing (seleno)protein [Pseudomarimonas arenosa]MBD8524635.1 hypothetical protein [Pseudomarimonas arenosa]